MDCLEFRPPSLCEDNAEDFLHVINHPWLKRSCHRCHGLYRNYGAFSASCCVDARYRILFTNPQIWENFGISLTTIYCEFTTIKRSSFRDTNSAEVRSQTDWDSMIVTTAQRLPLPPELITVNAASSLFLAEDCVAERAFLSSLWPATVVPRLKKFRHKIQANPTPIQWSQRGRGYGYDDGRQGMTDCCFLIEYRLKNHLWNKNKTTIIVRVCLERTKLRWLVANTNTQEARQKKR